MLFLLGSGFAAFCALYVVASVGVWHVPLLSKAVYHPSGPVRDVQPLSGYSQKDVFASLGARVRVNPASGQISTIISEEELTTIVAKSIREAEQEGTPPMEGVQIAIAADALEFSAITPSEKGEGIPIVVSVVPIVRDHTFALEVERLALGSLEVPHFLTSAIVATVGRTAIRTMNDALAEIGTLQRITLEEGKMEVFLSPN